MRYTLKLFAFMSLAILALTIGTAEAQTQGPRTNPSNRSERNNAEFQFSNLLAQARPSRRAGFSLMPPGRYADAGHSNVNITAAPAVASPPSVLGNGTVGQITKWVGTSSSGNSILGDSIITEFNGKIGIGLTAPTSKLTVAGMIETTLGGYKFPDGTIQTTAAGGGLQAIVHDATLTGNGTSAAPLGITVPLNLSGINGPIIQATQGGGTGLGSPGQAAVFADAAEGVGVVARGGSIGVAATGGDFGVDALARDGGTGVYGQGGGGTFINHAVGIQGNGGTSSGGGSDPYDTSGGTGVQGLGGTHPTQGGDGVVGIGGGASSGGIGGTGVVGKGGRGTNAIKGLAGLFDGDVKVVNHGNLLVESGTVTGFIVGQPSGITINTAGEFHGDVDVDGALSSNSLSVRGTKNFKIDHPLDPANKYLYHAAIESSEVMNLYTGKITLDANGQAVVQLPDWFEALNKDFRYSLTPIGAPGPNLYIAEEISANRFRIAGGPAGMKVSWQVTGVRQDAYMRAHPMKVEVVKSEKERDHYLRPELFDQPEEKSVEWARQPELMQQMKERREQMKQKRTQQ